MDAQTKFLQEFMPYAKKVSADTGIHPYLILTRWAGETGWGKRIIPGSFNLGNVISTNGKGIVKMDNGNRRIFRVFKDFDDYVNYEKFLFRKDGNYGASRNTSDPWQHFSVLDKNGYAEHRQYGKWMAKDMYNSVARRLGAPLNTAAPPMGDSDTATQTPSGGTDTSMAVGTAYKPQGTVKAFEIAQPKSQAEPKWNPYDAGLTKEQLEAIAPPAYKPTALLSVDDVLRPRFGSIAIPKMIDTWK